VADPTATPDYAAAICVPAGPGPGPVTLTASVELPARPASPRWARRHAQAALGAWNIPADAIETSVLLVSELVTNACTASNPGRDARIGTTITQTLRYQPGRIVIEVSDPDPRPPFLSQPGADAESGRGLVLVEALSKEWSYFYPPAGGKTVYCVVSCHSTEGNWP
jgi:anti-sigma regulatory factor (Ser/Thr protein kinase)